MKNWMQALRDSLVPGAIASLTTGAMLAWRGRLDSGSALAPINASTHVVWGDQAAQVAGCTLRHTLPGLAINTSACLWWALVLQKLFGTKVDEGGLPHAIMAGVATAGLSYLVDYRLLPRRLSPGWELNLTPRSLALALTAMGAGLALGSWLSAHPERQDVPA